MKKIIISLLYLLFVLGVAAQTVTQSSRSPVTEAEGNSTWDIVALVIAAISVSALLFYVVYLVSEKYLTKNKK